MKTKNIIAVTCIFILGLLLGAISHYLYINNLNKHYEENKLTLNLEKSMTMFWSLKYNKIDNVKKDIAEDIIFAKMKLKNNFKKEIKIPSYLDSSINIAIQYNDTGIKFTKYPYENENNK